MQLIHFLCTAAFAVSITLAVQFPTNPTSEMSGDEKSTVKSNKTQETSDESGHEIETDSDDMKDKKLLADAMRSVLDPNTVIIKHTDVVEDFKLQLENLEKENQPIGIFMQQMDKMSLDICKTSQQALWSYVTDINNEVKKNKMVRIAAEEDEVKKQYWNILKNKYINDEMAIDDKLRRKFRIIKERGTNVQMPQSKQREEIDTMQRIWSRVTVCAYNASVCNTDDSSRTMNDIISVFKTSNDSEELSYYWKVYRDATGKKIRPVFKDYVLRMNKVAKSENFTDAGDMWRFAFEDDNFTETVNKLWTEIKPMYDVLRDYVRAKLKIIYKDSFKNNHNTIPAHLLGNLWAQEWQVIYPKVAAYPNKTRPSLLNNGILQSSDLFDAVDDFHQSLGFESARDSYQGIKDTMTTANCLPSSHDMCDGVNYKIKWCGEEVSDVAVGLSRAARLLGHVQYFKHYRNLPPLYRDGPNPAFHDAISDIVAMQLISPQYLKTLTFVETETGPEATMNHLLWLAMEKFPLMAYAYVLDKWRWDVFSNKSTDNDWNQHWWNIRIKETGVSPPVPRNESDLDPAAKYHVVSHVQYITYLVSHVLEFQILSSLCKKANHTGPLHECSIFGVKEAGRLLSEGMALGASENWRVVLQTITGETELSTTGILEYFATLKEFLKEENVKLSAVSADDMDKSAPIAVGVIVIILTIAIIVLYCCKKHDVGGRMFSACGLSKNGSLDIATHNIQDGKTNEIDGIREDKV